jgi:hypothetical protein
MSIHTHYTFLSVAAQRRESVRTDTGATYRLFPCDHSLPHMSCLVTTACQNQVSAGVETNRVDRA